MVCILTLFGNVTSESPVLDICDHHTNVNFSELRALHSVNRTKSSWQNIHIDQIHFVLQKM